MRRWRTAGPMSWPRGAPIPRITMPQEANPWPMPRSGQPRPWTTSSPTWMSASGKAPNSWSPAGHLSLAMPISLRAVPARTQGRGRSLVGRGRPRRHPPARPDAAHGRVHRPLLVAALRAVHGDRGRAPRRPCAPARPQPRGPPRSLAAAAEQQAQQPDPASPIRTPQRRHRRWAPVCLGIGRIDLGVRDDPQVTRHPRHHLR